MRPTDSRNMQETLCLDRLQTRVVSFHHALGSVGELCAGVFVSWLNPAWHDDMDHVIGIKRLEFHRLQRVGERDLHLISNSG